MYIYIYIGITYDIASPQPRASPAKPRSFRCQVCAQSTSIDSPAPPGSSTFRLGLKGLQASRVLAVECRCAQSNQQ